MIDQLTELMNKTNELESKIQTLTEKQENALLKFVKEKSQKP